MTLCKRFSRPLLYAVVLAVVIAFLAAPAPAQKAKGKVIESTDPALRLQGYDKHLELTKASEFNTLKWYHIGPTNVSGRATDVEAVTPKGQNFTVYVATASGGVWKTVNEGTTWEPIFDKAPSTAIGDLAIATSNPDIVWVGTGEANIFRSSQSGCGIYKSTDAGKTWTHMGLADTNTIPRIVIHPTDPDIVYVAASGHEWTFNPERGVYKTTDGGQTWDKVFYIDEQTGAIDLAMDPENTETLYASVWQRIRPKWNDPRILKGFDQSGMYKSTDGGTTWKAINNGLPEGKYRGRIGFDVCLRSPNVLYMLLDNYEIAREPTAEELADSYGVPSSGYIKGATVYRSNDKGETWKKVCPVDDKMKQYMERHSNTFGWVFGQIRVDPSDPDTVYIMGVPLSVSKDGGKTFSRLSGMHGDHHGMWIDPDNSNYVINVNDGGIVISYDKGKTWRQFTHNLPVCQFFNISYDMDTPFHVYGSMQDHGSFRGVVMRNQNRWSGQPMEGYAAVEFEGAPGGEGSSHAIDPTDPNIVYSSGFYGTLSRTDLSKSGRDGRKSILPPTYPGETRLRGQWVAPTIISPHNPKIIYHGMQYLFRSENRGDTLERISPDMSYNIKEELGDIPYQTIFAISESPLRPGLIYIGTDDGKVHVTKDTGKTWKEIMTGLPYRKWVSRLVASQYDLGTVFMTQNGKREDDFNAYVWKSTDFGETWQDISGNIPLGPVNVIREDPANRSILYVGTDIGVYVTKDGGKTWTVLGGNLPSCYVHDLIIHPRDNVVVIGTHGRGMWALDAEAVNKKSQGGGRPRF
jgi:photosystem II stability/assembly factor-like uncharacterized protein